MFCFMIGGYHDSGFTALTIVSRPHYIVILIDDLLHAHHEHYELLYIYGINDVWIFAQSF